MRRAAVRAGTLVGIVVAAAALLGARPARRSPLAVGIPNPILFVTQMPVPGDFTTVASVFGNASGGLEAAPRGGDLWIQYPDGTRKNLTQLAGFGQTLSQDGSGIAVREPCVHWSGTKAVFSMVIGAPTAQFVQGTWFWQLYEVTGLGEAETPVITKVPNQPAGFDNVAPFYGTDERILFASDRPRNGAAHLYPQLDEYEEAPTVTGLWSLNPSTGDLRMLNHSPSGVFSPTIDSFGRVVFTRWDHLQRDQQADGDGPSGPYDQANPYGTFNFADESAGAAKLATRAEVYPEPRGERTDLLAGTNLVGHSLNHFFPWQIREDGTEEETLNHIGRHELHDFFSRVFDDDGNVVDFISATSGRVNPNGIQNFLEIKEDPTTPGRFFGIDAPEFQTHAGGQIVRMDLPVGQHPDQIQVAYVTNRATASPRLDTRPGAAGALGLLPEPAPAVGRHAPRRPHVRDARGLERGHACRAGLALLVPDPVARAGGRRDARRKPDAHVRNRQERLVLGSGRPRDVHERDALGARPRRGEGARETRGCRVAAAGAGGLDLHAGERGSRGVQGVARAAEPRGDREPRRDDARRARQAAAFQPPDRGDVAPDGADRRQALRRRAPAALPGRPDPRRRGHGEPEGGAPRPRAGDARAHGDRHEPAEPGRACPAACASGTTAPWRRSCPRTAPSRGR